MARDRYQHCVQRQGMLAQARSLPFVPVWEPECAFKWLMGQGPATTRLCCSGSDRLPLTLVPLHRAAQAVFKVHQNLISQMLLRLRDVR